MRQMDLFGNVVQDLTADEDGDKHDATEPEPPPQKRGRGRGRARGRARIVGAGSDTTGAGGSPAADVAPTVGGTAVDAAVVAGHTAEVAATAAGGSGGGHRVEVAASIAVVSGGVAATLGSELLPAPPCVETGTIVTTSSTLTFDSGIYCTKCGYTVDPMTHGTRVVRKSPPMFVCSK